MLEILNSCLSLLVGLGETIWGLLTLVSIWAGEMLYHLHVSAPRLEGLLVGVALTWVMLRRDKHPLLRVLSAPLKLVLDILDLGWDQCVDVVGDLWGTVRDWTVGVVKWVKARIVGTYSWIMSLLTSIKNKLLSRKEKEE